MGQRQGSSEQKERQREESEFSPAPGQASEAAVHRPKKKKSDEQRRETRIFQNIPDGETAWVKAGEPWGEE